MKIFTNKKIWKKIAIALVVVILFQFIILSPVKADDDVFTGDDIGIGGKLLEPIIDLVVWLGDRNFKSNT